MVASVPVSVSVCAAPGNKQSAGVSRPLPQPLPLRYTVRKVGNVSRLDRPGEGWRWEGRGGGSSPLGAPGQWALTKPWNLESASSSDVSHFAYLSQSL